MMYFLAPCIWLWSCKHLWRVRQTLSGIWNVFPPEVSLLEQFIKRSYASIARAFYDHKLVGNFTKFIFKHESLPVSKDFPSIASFPKLSLYLENSLSPYLYFHCIVLVSSCMNFSHLRF